MDTLSRSCLILILLFFALTGYSQNMRTRSSTTTFATTNYGHTTHSNLTASTAVTAPPSGKVVLLASNDTFYALNSSGVLTDLGAASAAGQIDTAKTVWVSTDGNDGTGIRGRQDKPFLTIIAGVAASLGGDLVHVRSGVYVNQTNLLKQNVHMYFDAGAQIRNTNTGVGGQTIFNGLVLTTSASTNIIDGFGDFEQLDHEVTRLGAACAIVQITNPASTLVIRGHRFGVGSSFDNGDETGGGVVGYGGNLRDGTVYVEIDELEDVYRNIVSGNPWIGFYWVRGDNWLHCKRMRIGASFGVYGSEPAGGATNSLYYRGDYIDCIGGTPIYMLGVSDSYAMWFEVLAAQSSGASPGLCVSQLGGGKLYVTAQKLRGASVVQCAAGRSWVNAQKLSAISSAASEFVNYASGYHFLSAMEYEAEGEMARGFTITGGTNEIVGGRAIVTNAIGVMLSGSHATRLSDMIIQTVNTSGSGNSNECILSITNGLKLHNMTLAAPSSSVNSIKSTNTLNPIIVEGTLQMNTAPGASVVFYGGPNLIGSTIVHNGADQFKILTNAFSGFNVFLDLATNTMQFLLATNNFTLIPTNQNVGQRISFTMFNPTATSVTIVLPAVQIYGSGISNVVAAGKRLKTAWESQDAAVTNVSAAFAQQKN